MDACRAVIVTADPLPESVRGGDRIDLAVHVVNDSRADVNGMQVRARVVGPGGSVVSEQRWEGTARADDCVLVGRIEAEVPVGPPGTIAVDLTLAVASGSGHPSTVVATNRYTTTVS